MLANTAEMGAQAETEDASDGEKAGKNRRESSQKGDEKAI